LLGRAAVVMLLAVTVACASKSDEGGTVAPMTAPATSAGSPGPTLPPIDASILYRDDEGNLVARDLKTGDLHKQTVDFNEEVIVQADCTPDGSQIGYLKQNFSETFRRLQINGEIAPSDYIQVPASVQGFTWSPDAKQIAIAEWDQTVKKATVSLIDVVTGQISEIATADKLVAGLAWSPDGSRLTYYKQDLATGTATVEVLAISGGDPREPIDNDDLQWLDPVWTPDGESLIVTGLSPTAAQLYRVDVDSGDMTQITQDESIYRRGPQFSPDGSLIAFTGSIIAPGVSAVAVMLHQFGIFTVKPDGTDEAPVTADPRTNPGAAVDPYLNAYMLGWCAPGPWLDDLWVLEEASQ
jgi:dipeptidyl aminopeptidase/acylaminoacyl peptidase